MVYINFWFMLGEVNILGGNTHNVKRNDKALTIVSMEIGLDVNSEKNKDTVMSQHQHAGQITI